MVAAPTRKRRSLRETLAYRNDEVIERFLGNWKISRPAAVQIFDDLLRFLWLTSDPKVLAIKLAPVPIIDEMWHTFLVFTLDYMRFTEKYCGFYLLHEPRTAASKKADRARAKKDPHGFMAEYADTLTRHMSAVYDQLGADVVLRWYVTYNAKYGGTFFRTKGKPLALAQIPLPKRLRALAGM
jgi:hypothetical protein